MLSFFKNNSPPQDWKCLNGKATKKIDNHVVCLTVDGKDCMSNACINDKLIYHPLQEKIENPLKPEKSVTSTSDYIYYLIDIIVSIIAITLALMSTKDNYNQRFVHVIAAIMFRYVYIGYFLINNGLSLTLFKSLKV